ncbi:hypothetical protein ACQWF4_23790, partial [Salmonella enterica subsp. enterica serovar Infantis]
APPGLAGGLFCLILFTPGGVFGAGLGVGFLLVFLVVFFFFFFVFFPQINRGGGFLSRQKTNPYGGARPQRPPPTGR